MSVNTSSRWDPAAYAKNASFVPALGGPALAMLAPKAGERILDLGCGDGVLTKQIAASGAKVVGVDASGSMVSAAGGKGLDARLADGERLAFINEFDAAFSNAALHWMLDARAVARGVFRALKSGGRFVGEMGGEGNIATLRQALRDTVVAMGFTPPDEDPQWYPSVAEFTSVYHGAGFTQVVARLIDRPTPLATGVAAWLRTFRAGFIDASGVPEEAREELIATAAARAEALLPRDHEGVVLADYVRLRFTMRKL